MIHSLNNMGSARHFSSASTCFDSEPDAAQELSQRRLVMASSEYGDPVGWSPREAFESTIKSKDLYSLEASTVRPYSREKLRILREGVKPLPLRPRLPEDAALRLDRLWTHTVRSQRDMEILLENNEVAGITPYWDVELRRDRTARINLMRELAAVGLVTFQVRIYCRAALFFVDKKGVAIRMIVDGREASQNCHRPPYSPLGSAGAWAEFDLSDATMTRNGLDPSSPLWGGAADLQDGFHQFTDETLGSLFGFDFPETAGTYGTSVVYDPSLRCYVQVSADTLVYPVYIGLAMGWSWSLWFCQRVLADSMVTGTYAIQPTFSIGFPRKYSEKWLDNPLSIIFPAPSPFICRFPRNLKQIQKSKIEFEPAARPPPLRPPPCLPRARIGF